MSVLSKRCTKCGILKPATDYYPHPRGMRGECKQCGNAVTRLAERRNAERDAPRDRLAAKRYREKLRNQALVVLGGKCCRCGFDDFRALQIDHKDGGGCKEAKLLSTSGIRRKILQGKTDEYQLLCANCNWIKRYENGEVAGVRKYLGGE